MPTEITIYSSVFGLKKVKIFFKFFLYLLITKNYTFDIYCVLIVVDNKKKKTVHQNNLEMFFWQNNFLLSVALSGNERWSKNKYFEQC